MPDTPQPNALIAPIARNMQVKTAESGGPIVALAFDGEQTQYLMLNRKDSGKPVWVSQDDVFKAWIAPVVTMPHEE
jgi:hypothetical protein